MTHLAPTPPRRPLPARARAAVGDPQLAPLWLLVILLIGALFRFTGLEWDEGLHHHPDERHITDVTSWVGWPSSLGEYLDEARNPLNPRNVMQDNPNDDQPPVSKFPLWAYGDLPLALVKGTTVLLDRVRPLTTGGTWSDYGHNYLVGRVLNGLADLGTLLLLYLTARRLYRDHRVALLGALLYSMAVLPIQHAHFWVVDNMTTFFVALTIYALSRIVSSDGSGRVTDYLLAGLFFGMALASKVSVATLAILFAAVGLLKLVQGRSEEGAFPPGLASGLILRLGLATLAGILSVRFFQPNAFSGFLGLAPRWLNNIREVQGQISGAADPPWGFQWASRVRLLFPWKNMVLWGLGLPLGLAAWAGWATAAWQLIRRQRWMHLIPVLWIFVLFMHQGNQWVMSMRYLLPLYPMAVLLAAWWLIWLLDQAAPQLSELRRGGLLSWRRGMAMTVAAVVVLGTAIYALGFMNIFTHPHTHAQAVRWLAANAEEGSVIATEHYDEGLPAILGDAVLLGRFQLGVTYLDREGNVHNDGQLLWYNGDNPEKLTTALGWLDEVDYIVIISNRIYGSVARLPARYPLTNNYYDALFDGRLGFERVAEIKEQPKLFGLIELDDQYSRSGPGLFGLDWDTWLAAEEAFSVYDHPRVLIFKKTPAYSRERAEQLLMEGVDFNNISQLTAKQWTDQGGAAQAAPPVFDAATRAEMEQRGSWSQLFSRDGFANRFPLLPWLLVLEVMGLLALPFLWVVGAGLPYRGFALAKPLGLLLVGFVIWLLASLKLVTFSAWGIFLAMLLVGVLSAVVAWRNRFWATLGDLRATGRPLLRAELLFWIPFLIVLAIRWANPDLWHPALGGEKPMDLSYLNAVVKSAYFPPLDPWFAGGYLNYYYFGFVLSATLIKLTGVMPSIAYNLLIPTFFAMLAAAVWVAALGLVDPQRLRDRVRRWSPRLFAALAVVMVGFLGNLAELRVMSDVLSQASSSSFSSALPGVATAVKTIDGFLTLLRHGGPLPGRMEWPYWTATRVIPDTINEMPWFTFLYADLHAHLMALPLTALLLALAVAWLRAPHGRSRGARLLAGGLMALVLGALWPTNTWDVPTYALVLFGALGLREWWRDGRITPRALLETLIMWIAILLVARLLFQPYHAAYQAGYTSLERWRGERTGLADYLLVHGFFLFIFTVALIHDFLRGTGHNGAVRLARQTLRHAGRLARLSHLRRLLVRDRSAHWLLPLGGLIMAAGVVLIPLGWPVPGVNLILAGVVLLLLLRATPQPLWQMALVLILIGLGLTTAVELFVLKGDVGRMNTVFKFYLQVWVLWGIAGAVAVARLERLRMAAEWRVIWRAGFVALFAISLLYPIFSTYAKINDRFDRTVGPGLNGAAFMMAPGARYAVGPDGVEPTSFDLRWDAEAIQWMQDKLPGSPTIAEVSIPQLYRWGNRYAMWTGNPAIVGWDWHQRQQRGVQSIEVSQRVNEVLAMYAMPDAAAAHEILTRYGAHYLVVGPLERAYATPEGIAKFEQYRGTYWDLVYENPEVRIYRVLP